MNAPASILPPSLARYVETIITFLPGCHGKELELRCRIMSARDTSAASLARGLCGEEACGVMSELNRLATLHAYAPAEIEDLQALLEALRSMMRATAFLDQFAGGPGARG